MVQAGRRFQRALFTWLLDYGFTRCHADPCVFTLNNADGHDRLILGIYVDDVMVLHSSKASDSAYERFRSAFFSRWEAEDEGHMTDLLNVQIRREDNGDITLHQEPYITSMMERFLPDGPPTAVQTNSTPTTAELAQQVADAALADPQYDTELSKRYSSLVGSLIYAATQTRPDIAYAVSMLSRVLAKATPTLMTAAERVLAYLYRHRHVGLRYSAVPSDPDAFSDSNWDVRRSTSGWLIRWQMAAVFFGAKAQKTVALSSAEAEIVALSEAAKDCVYFQAFCDEVDPPAHRPLTLACDNQAARDLAYNPEHHERTKHVARRHFFVREVVEDHAIRVPFVRSHDNLADFFTKHLTPKHFFALRKVIMNIT